MARDKRDLFTLPDGQLSICATNCEDNDPRRASIVAKTAFELGRSLMQNPALSGADLEEWRRNLHFNAYAGPPLLTSRECLFADLPTDRYFRDAWEDDGANINVDPLKARIIQEELIVRAYNRELDILLDLYLFALASGDIAEQSRISVEANGIKQLAQNVDLTALTTLAELNAAWPSGLRRIR